MMNRWQRLFEGIKTEIKVFIFFSALLTAFRIVFLAVFQSQLASVTMENILTSLWLGFRLSLKTVGSLCLLGFLGGTLVHTFVPKWPSLRIKQIVYSIATVLLTFLFLGRIYNGADIIVFTIDEHRIIRRIKNLIEWNASQK